MHGATLSRRSADYPRHLEFKASGSADWKVQWKVRWNFCEMHLLRQPLGIVVASNE